MLIRQVDREAVDLQLAQEVVLGAADVLVDALGPGRQLQVVERVVQGEHAGAVDDGRELRLVGPGDLLGRGVRRAQLGVLLLQRLQGAQEFVELRVADDRGVVHVVPEAVLLDLLSELRVLLPCLCGHRRLRLPVAGHRVVLPSLRVVREGSRRPDAVGESMARVLGRSPRESARRGDRDRLREKSRSQPQPAPQRPDTHDATGRV